MDRILLNRQEFDGSYKKQSLQLVLSWRGKGSEFWDSGSQNSFFLSRAIHLESFWLNQEHMTAKSAALNTGGAEEKLKHLWNSSRSPQALIPHISPRACPAHIEIVGKQGLFTRLTAAGDDLHSWEAFEAFPPPKFGILGLGCRRGRMAEPWRLLQCHTPGKSILCPKNPFPWHCSHPQRPKRDGGAVGNLQRGRREGKFSYQVLTLLINIYLEYFSEYFIFNKSQIQRRSENLNYFKCFCSLN